MCVTIVLFLRAFTIITLSKMHDKRRVNSLSNGDISCGCLQPTKADPAPDHRFSLHWRLATTAPQSQTV